MTDARGPKALTGEKSRRTAAAAFAKLCFLFCKPMGKVTSSAVTLWFKPAILWFKSHRVLLSSYTQF